MSEGSSAPGTSAVTVEIAESATGGAGRHTYVAILRDRDGNVVAGKDVLFALQGDGSLAPGFSSQQIRRETDESGTTRITWYRRSIYGRAVKARLSVSSVEPGCSVSVEETAPEASQTSYDLPGRHKTQL